MEITMQLLDKEVTNSFKKHGDWSDYSVVKMFDKIEDEFKEVTQAYFNQDNSSNHRLSIELLQVAVCCIKMSNQIRRRYEVTKND